MITLDQVLPIMKKHWQRQGFDILLPEQMLVKDILLIDNSKVDFYAVVGMSQRLVRCPTNNYLWAAYFLLVRYAHCLAAYQQRHKMFYSSIHSYLERFNMILIG
jgi:hypothetical protein